MLYVQFYGSRIGFVQAQDAETFYEGEWHEFDGYLLSKAPKELKTKQVAPTSSDQIEEG